MKSKSNLLMLSSQLLNDTEMRNVRGGDVPCNASADCKKDVSLSVSRTLQVMVENNTPIEKPIRG